MCSNFNTTTLVRNMKSFVVESEVKIYKNCEEDKTARESITENWKDESQY